MPDYLMFTARRAAVRLWDKANNLINDGLDAGKLDNEMIAEIQNAAAHCETIYYDEYDAWQERGGRGENLSRLDALIEAERARKCECRPDRDPCALCQEALEEQEMIF